MNKNLVAVLVFLVSCNTQKDSILSETMPVLDYLKATYKVDPQVDRFDSVYLKKLIAQNKSLDADALITSNITVSPYKPLGLDFIEYYHHYYYKDPSGTDCYKIYLIRDNRSGKYYQDFIDPEACTINEPYCLWSMVKNSISRDDVEGDFSEEDIIAYNSIKSESVFGENEIGLNNKPMGIQSYLNSAHKFSRPSKSQLDSLFSYYDKHHYRVNDTLLKARRELFSFLRIQANQMRRESNYGQLNNRLHHLKDRINLLLLQTNTGETENLMCWIYKNNAQLRVRRIQINGSQKSTYSYLLEEYQACF